MLYLKKLYRKIKPFIDKVNYDNIFAIAGQSAFFMLLSVIPLAAFVLSIIQSFHIPVETVSGLLSGTFTDTVVDYTTEFFADVSSTSTSVSLISLFITLWSASRGIHSLANGMNRIYGSYENRNWFAVKFRAVLYTAVFLVILILSLALLVLGSTINSWLTPYLTHLPDFVALLYSLRYIIVFIYLTVLFCLLYRNFPNISKKDHKEYSFKYQLPGAVLCSICWFALSLGISVYVDDFNGFSIYGSLTKFAVVMIWFYFCMLALMLCAEFNYVYHQSFKAFGKKLKRKK